MDTRQELGGITAEPIAIVGVGCHLPGNISCVEELVAVLREGRDCVTEVPPDRWPIDVFYDPDALGPGKTYVRHGGFVHDIDRFDAAFFGIADAEASRMDPQQRMALQTVWHALENAGQSAEELLRSKTSVFLAMMNTNGYSQLKSAIEGSDGVTGYDAVGDAMSITAGRISHFLGLEGPCVALDTACSGSMVAAHLACRSILLGECDSAIVVGVSAMLHPGIHIAFSKLGLMSRKGRCAVFDESADGYIRGEGCIAVLLRRQSLALARRDRIFASIMAAAINQDGHTPAITAPNGASQEKVIRMALRRVGAQPNDIGYVEAHGTGTPVGDPIEMRALVNVYGPGRSTPLYVGSVKSNFGHLEAGAGLLGLVKAALSLNEEVIFPSLHFRRMNSNIDLGNAPIQVAAQTIAWPRGERRRMAGVNSFGYSGTNAHAILQEAEPGRNGEAPPARPCEMVALSAKSVESLRQLVDRWTNFLAENSASLLSDIAFTAATGRTHWRHRLAVVGSGKAEINQALRSWREGRPSRGIAAGQITSRRKLKTAFVFTGLGVEYEQMGRQLYELEPEFRAAIDRVAAQVDPELAGGARARPIERSDPPEGPLREVLFGSSSAELLSDQRYAAPALFAIQYALATLLSYWGIEPDYVIGHGVGEIAAACTAGVLNLEGAAKLAAGQNTSVRLAPAKLPVVSSVTGAVLSDEATSERWTLHLQTPSLFLKGIGTIIDAGCTLLIEIGPHPALGPDIVAAFDMSKTRIAATLDRDGPAEANLLGTLANLYVMGAPVRLDRLFPTPSHHRVSLPLYPFRRERHWVYGELSAEAKVKLHSAIGHHDRVGSTRAAFVKTSGAAETELASGVPDTAELHEIEWQPTEAQLARREEPVTDQAASLDQPFRLDIPLPGNFDHLTWRSIRREVPGTNQVEIQVSAAGLNFKDVLKAMGTYPGLPDGPVPLGSECSGRIVAVGPGLERLAVGDAVLALAPFSAGSFVTVAAALVWPKPPHLSFEEAATIPVAFLTAVYALRHLGQLAEGERVLIHAASGGVGLAAVQIAQQAGAEIFATAGNPEKRAFLEALGVRHVMDSRSLEFADEVLALTGGRGVDVVLNSLSGAGMLKSLEVLAPLGRFLEIGKRDIYQNREVGLAPFEKQLAYFSIDLERLFVERPVLGVRLFREVMQGFESGVFKPLRLRVFPITKVVDAFREMGQAKHIGKIIISMPRQEPAASAAPAAGVPVGAAADDWLAAADPEMREVRLGEFLRVELGRALRVAADEIIPEAPFVTMGMDSLMAMELRSRVQAALGTSFPTTLFFTHPNVSTLARGLLDLWIETRDDPAKRYSPIHRVSREDGLALSFAQEQLWFLHQLLPSSNAYNVAVQIRVRGLLDHATLAKSLDAIVARHEVFRMTFRSEIGVPRAVVAASLHVDLPIHDVSDESEVTAWGLRDAASPFDLASGPVFRVRLLRFNEAHHVLLVTLHHIITDGWSFGVLLRDLGDLYHAFRRGEPSPLAEMTIQYADYAAWQRQWLQGEALESLLAFWKRDLEGAPLLELSTDRPRPRMPSFRGSRMRFELGRSRTQALRALCEEENLTLFIPLMAAFAALLQRYSGQDDFVIGTLTANRTRLEIENLIGFFVNALPVRVHLVGDPDVRELLSRIRQRMLDVMAHQDAPFEFIVNATERHREASRNPLFQVQLVLQASAGKLDQRGLEIEMSEIDTETAKRDLTLTFFDDEALSGHVEYATDFFDAVRIEQLIRHFEILIDAITLDRGRRLSSLPLLTESEQALYTKRACPQRPNARSIQQMFESAVDRAPDAVAMTAGSSSLTYRRLDRAANRLARWLRRRGVGPNTPVALSVGRSPEMLIGFLGILKAGGVYVPIDPAYPEDRTDYMLADAKAVLQLDGVDDPEIVRESPERVDALSAPDHLAYIIYTSGSTGKPKGVMVTHGSVVEYADTLGRELGIEPGDVFLHTASISFSSSIRQFVVPLSAGAAVAIADMDERRDPIALLRRIRDSRVTVIDLVPTVVGQIVSAVAALRPAERAALVENRVRLLLTASEPLRFGLVHDWRAHMGRGTCWINMYGQTETTGIVSLYPVPETRGDDQRIVPIGRPRGNVVMLVLDRHLRPLPCGVAGDLYIGGEALAQGYAGDPALTAERFIPSPWDDGERLYAAGDVVRLGWDGTMEFLGRADQQVKIRGFRIEPAEIERVLLEHSSVREAVVSVCDDGGEDRWLVAYYTTKGSPIPLSALRAHARQKLPEPMVPSAFVALDRLPLTPNGKVDREALPNPERMRADEVEYVPPQAGVEESLAGIWRQVLRADRVGAGDNFFSLGGHSLLAAQVRSRIQNALGVDLPLGAIFEDQTLSALAQRIEASLINGWKQALPTLLRVARTETMPASYAQELMWQLEEAEPGSRAHWIDVALRIRGPLDASRLVRSVQSAAERHELLRTVFRPARGSLSQVILGSHVPDVRVTEESESSHSELDRERIDLAACPPIQAEIVRTHDGDHTLHLLVHRILSDGFSTRLLLGEIGALYANATGGTQVPLLDTAIQYVDYAAWEREWLTGEALAKQVEFFRRELKGPDVAWTLPTDHPRPGLGMRRGSRLHFELPLPVSDAAHATAARERASLYMVLLAAFASAIGRYVGRPVVVIGSPTSRRTHPGTEQILGPFMNTLPLRIDHRDGSSLSELVRHVKAVLLEALAHQDAPFHHVTAELATEHGPAAAGVGEVVFGMDDPAPREFVVGDLALTRVESVHVTPRRELTLSVVALNREIAGTMTYDRDLFNVGTIQRIVRDFEAAVASARDDNA